jgi:hypothetical protein
MAFPVVEELARKPVLTEIYLVDAHCGNTMAAPPTIGGITLQKKTQFSTIPTPRIAHPTKLMVLDDMPTLVSIRRMPTGMRRPEA